MSEWTVKKDNTSIQEIEVFDKNDAPVINMADATHIDFQVKKKSGDEVPIISKTKDDGIEILTGDDIGKLRITLLPADTEIDVAQYLMGLQIRWDEITNYEVDLTIDGRRAWFFRIVEDYVEIPE